MRHTDSGFVPSPSVKRSSTILVVDDSPVNIQVLVRTLDGTGHRILVATNGKTALEIAQRVRPDLILLDVMMPEMDGFEVCRAIKSSSLTDHIVVIFLSALGEVEDKVAGLQLGAVDYITKPIQADEVLARVSNHLAVQRLERELRTSRDALDQELASAAEMQRLILPSSLPRIGGVSFVAHYETSRHVGGDYYDVVSLPEGRCGILIADVSGHGAPSAIIMAMIRAVFHTFPGPPLDPPAVLQFINRHFQFLWGASMLATALYGVLDTKEHRFRVACAGHLPPLLLRRDTVCPMECHSTIPLLLMDMPAIPCTDYAIEPGDRLLFYTDGVTEREDTDGNMYEMARLMNAFRAGLTLDPKGLLESIAIDLDRFGSGRELTDDQTLLLVSMNGR